MKHKEIKDFIENFLKEIENKPPFISKVNKNWTFGDVVVYPNGKIKYFKEEIKKMKNNKLDINCIIINHFLQKYPKQFRILRRNNKYINLFIDKMFIMDIIEIEDIFNEDTEKKFFEIYKEIMVIYKKRHKVNKRMVRYYTKKVNETKEPELLKKYRAQLIKAERKKNEHKI